jgi:hypothetical protein
LSNIKGVGEGDRGDERDRGDVKEVYLQEY